MPRRRRIVPIPSGRSALGPSYKRGNLFRRKRRIVGKVPDDRIGKPRRHRPVFRRRCNRRRERSRLLVRFESHRRNAFGAMTQLAALLQDRHDIAIKRWCARSRLSSAGGSRRCQKQRLVERSHHEHQKDKPGKKQRFPRWNVMEQSHSACHSTSLMRTMRLGFPLD